MTPKTIWTQPLPPGRTLRARRHAEATAQAEQLVTLARETDAAIRERSSTEGYGWSPEDLRGIPAIGRNVAGAIPGTSPHADR